MHRRLRATLLATVVVAPVITASLTTAAQADPSADDLAAQTISLRQQDKAGDVKVARKSRGKLSKKALAAVDLTAVSYDLDRVAQVATITYAVRHAPVTVKGARQYFASLAVNGDPDAATSMVVLVSRPGSRAVQTMGIADAKPSRCAGGVSSLSHGGRVMTQIVPFSCLAGVEHAQVQSGIGFERRDGTDVAFDTARPTRDLPFTAYVAPEPPAPPAP